MSDDLRVSLAVALYLMLWLPILILLYNHRKRKKQVLPTSYPQIIEVASLTDVPDYMKLTDNLVYVRNGLSSKGLYMYNGQEFIKLENKVCPTCGK